jgi:hypothetical protein
MVLRMQYSEYSKKFRYEVVDSALKAYRVRQDEEKEGVRPMHKPKSWNKNEREEAKVWKKENWYKENGDESVIFVPPTPGSELQRRYRREIKRQGFKVKVVEKSGATLKHMLQKSDPCRSPTCNRINCLVCRTEGKGKCDREGVTYEIKCNGCDSEYIGETARSAYTTGVEHLQALEKKNERSVLWRHCEEKHDNEIQEFKMNVTGMYNNDAMARQIAESVRISILKLYQCR